MNHSAMTSHSSANPLVKPLMTGPRGPGQASHVDRASLAARGFARWFKEQHDAGQIALPVEGMLAVQPDLSSKFCIGLHGHRYFIGVPKTWCDWFSALPWACISVDPSTGRVAFVCREVNVPGLVIPAFSLSFDVNPAGYSQALAHYHFLDIRAVEPIRGSTALSISREVHFTASIRTEDPIRLLSDIASDSLQ
ncbi:hypothetical protein ABIC83_002706 [Roseateles asaccharophilus]|uniref:hypothetical protein n=1 Tax=Roseateles asaccharophilus TaxID=582607 RepID=UPI0038349F20